MPSFAKSPPELVARFNAITDANPGAERRQMFGYPCLFVAGNMVTGLHESAWFVRLASADGVELLRLPGATPFEPIPGRPMGGYTVLPPSVTADDQAVRHWVERAIDFGQSLPVRAPKASTPRGSRTARLPGS